MINKNKIIITLLFIFCKKNLSFGDANQPF